MQVSNVNSTYYTPYRSNTNVKAISGFLVNDKGKIEVKEADKEWKGFAEFVDYQDFHRQWMSQSATTAFSYTQNKGFNKADNSISLVSGMSAQLANGFKLSINDYMVQADGDFRNNNGARKATQVASAMSSLIKVANGQISLGLFHSLNPQENSANAKIGLEAFGIDTSKAFKINDTSFYYDEMGKIRLSTK